MTSVKYLLATFVISHALFAQHLNHSLLPGESTREDARSFPRPFRTAADTLDVLAVMVQFQADADARTTGNGQFDLSIPTNAGLDAPPHDAQYFLDHLTFLSTYYRKVSKGKLIVRPVLLDTVYTLSSQMQRYSPPKNGPNTVLGDLARDTWQQVDASGRVPDFSRYDCFVVFHAGVGRDIDLVSIVGYDPTPLDIPSLYLGLNAFKQFYGATYDGIPVRNGFKITNTIIMPETETRELPATPTNVLLRLGINGLLAASVGSFLGLPDLFDTNTGKSGIGRFGLMDGQAIFSFDGLFPPEPSAWEKYWLGWIQPITVGSGDTTLKTLPAISTSDRSDRIDTVYRVPISSSEYFLVENRNRDWAQNGQRITSSYRGTTRQQTFVRDTAGFDPREDLSTRFSAIRGVVTDVDDFDWSLPGGVGTNNTFFDGGILIWHIDETVIAQSLASNSVNANPERRGVDVEEADGSQDIGQSYGQFDPGSGSEEGTALDFWYQGNASPLFKNRFSSNTYPNSMSTIGANSHITIRDFSTRSPRMTAKIIVGDDVALLPGFPKSLPNKPENISLTVADLGHTIGQSIFVTTGTTASNTPRRGTTGDASKIYAWKTDGNGVVRADGVFAVVGMQGATFRNSLAIKDLNRDGVSEVLVGEVSQTSSMVRGYSARPQASDSLASPFLSQTTSTPLASTPVIGNSTIAVGQTNGRVLILGYDGSVSDSSRRFDESSSIAGIVLRKPQTGFDVFVGTSSNGEIDFLLGNQSNKKVLGNRIIGIVSGEINTERNYLVVSSDGRIHLLDDNLMPVSGFPIAIGAQISLPPAIADVDGDGIRDIIVFAGNKIYVYNYAGASLDNFPIRVPSSQPITSHPVIADVDGDGLVDVVAVTRDGIVAAYNKNGTMARGFPLQAGTGNQSVAAFELRTASLSTTDIGLAVASSEDGTVIAWKTGSVRVLGLNHPWPQYQHDAEHTGLATEPLAGTPLSSAFFPKERAYNWPNPVYEGKTYIRYFVKENATVKIKILDLAGDLVTEFSGPGRGGVDNEVEWNVRDVQSGIYLARIEATGGGKTETAIIKVAVVK
jgi:hypothetical protein